MPKIDYDKYGYFETPNGEVLEGMKARDNAIYRFVHYNKFELFRTDIPLDSVEVKLNHQWIEENRYGTKEYLKLENNYFYNTKNFLDDGNYKKYFVGKGKYMVAVSPYGSLSIFIVPDYIVPECEDYTCEGRYHIREMKKYRYIVVQYPSLDRDAILIRIHKFRYLFIGKVICEFDYQDEITDFGDDFIVGKEGKMFIK